MKRIAILLAGILSQICLGTMYAWSVFGQQLQSDYGFGTAESELIYGLGIGTFAIGTIVTGRLVYRIGPRWMTLISAALFILSFLGASLSAGSYPLLLAFLGPGLGIAIAFGYVCPLTTAVAWYPQHKGLVTGLAVMGFGGGAFISASIARALLAAGWPILDTFAALGIGGGLLIALAALFLRLPPPKDPEHDSLQAPRILKHQRPFQRTAVFWALAFSMFLATFGGLIVIGSVLGMAKDYSLENYGPLAMALLTLGNACGRLLWGMIMDKLGSRTLVVSFGVMTLGFVLLSLAPGNLFLFLAGILLTGLQFGASLVIFATWTERYYGAGAIGRVYPWIFACYGLAAIVGPWSGGAFHDHFASYPLLMVVLAIMPILGGLVILLGIRATLSNPLRQEAAQ